ncbi:MAG: alpha/beta hydrolase [Chloroflexota bacterium]
MTTPSLYKTAAGEKAVMDIYDKALAQWPVAYETLILPTRHGDTFVIACGSETALPLILLHGAGTNSTIWRGDIRSYSQNYRVYAVDLLGEAGKSAANRPAWDSPAYAEWLEDLLDALHIEKAALVGISQGGWTALKFAVNQPTRVENLVLICPGGVVPDKKSFIIRAIGFSLMGKKGLQRMIRLLYGKQPIPEGVEDAVAVVMGNFKARLGILPIFSDMELGRLTMPTLLIGGTDDPMRDLDSIAARLQTFVPNLKVDIIPGAGHVVLNTIERIMTFLNMERSVHEMSMVTPG